MTFRPSGDYLAQTSVFWMESSRERRHYIRSVRGIRDAAEHKFLEEVGTMNLFVQIGDVFITPPLEGSILDGVTRDSITALLRDWKYEVIERPIAVDEIERAHADGRLKEVFGCGTGAVISPVGELGYKGKRMVINGKKPGAVSQRLFQELTGIQQGRIADTRGWMVAVS